MTESNNPPSVVLVHGGFVDGSDWQSVYRLVRNDGYAVGVVQNPTLSLDGDVAAARLIIDEQDGPVVRVPHSYGAGAALYSSGDTGGLLPNPAIHLGTLVSDPSSDTEAAWPLALGAPLVAGADGQAQVVGDVLNRPKPVAGLGRRVCSDWHGWYLRLVKRA
jgi:hypothetical protein